MHKLRSQLPIQHVLRSDIKVRSWGIRQRKVGTFFYFPPIQLTSIETWRFMRTKVSKWLHPISKKNMGERPGMYKCNYEPLDDSQCTHGSVTQPPHTWIAV